MPKPIPPQRAYLALTRTSRAWTAPPQGAGAAEVAAGAAVEEVATAVLVGAAAEVTTGVEVTTAVEVAAGAEVAALLVAAGAEVAATEVAAAEVAAAEVAGADPPEPLIVKSTQDSSEQTISEIYSYTTCNKVLLTGLVNRTRIPPPLKNTSSRSRALASKVRQRHTEMRLVRLEGPRDARIFRKGDQRSTDNRVGRSVDDRDVRGSGVGSTNVSHDREDLTSGEGLDVGGVYIRELKWKAVRRSIKMINR